MRGAALPEQFRQLGRLEFLLTRLMRGAAKCWTFGMSSVGDFLLTRLMRGRGCLTFGSVCRSDHFTPRASCGGAADPIVLDPKAWQILLTPHARRGYAETEEGKFQQNFSRASCEARHMQKPKKANSSRILLHAPHEARPATGKSGFSFIFLLTPHARRGKIGNFGE